MKISLALGATSYVPTAGSPPTWAPTDLSGLLWWFDASQLALADNDPVASFTDLSGNGKHATAAGTAQPTFKTNIINGKPVLRFDGTTDAMTIPATDMSGTATLNLYVVYNHTNTATDSIVIENSANYNSSTTGWITLKTAADKINASHRGANVVISGFTTTTSFVGSFIRARFLFDKSLTTNEITIWVGGTAVASDGTGNNNATGNFGNNASYLGARAATSIFAAMDVAEIILVNRALTAGEVTSADAYLLAKYGV